MHTQWLCLCAIHAMAGKTSFFHLLPSVSDTLTFGFHPRHTKLHNPCRARHTSLTQCTLVPPHRYRVIFAYMSFDVMNVFPLAFSFFCSDTSNFRAPAGLVITSLTQCMLVPPQCYRVIFACTRFCSHEHHLLPCDFLLLQRHAHPRSPCMPRRGPLPIACLCPRRATASSLPTRLSHPDTLSSHVLAPLKQSSC